MLAELDAMQPHVLDEDRYYRTRAIVPESLAWARRAARFVFSNRTCFNGLHHVNRVGQFSVPFGRYAAPPTLYNRTSLLRISELLLRAQVYCGDFEATMQDAGPGDFAYLDPHNVPPTATAWFTSCTKEAFAVEDHQRLAETVHALTERGCKVLVSNSATPLVRALYAGYRIDEVLAPRSISSDPTGRQKMPELLIRNCQLPCEREPEPLCTKGPTRCHSDDQNEPPNEGDGGDCALPSGGPLAAELVREHGTSCITSGK
jgi:DNA adenine methylase